MKSVTPVILAGGSGTRLWPLSRSLFPKQLLPLCSDATMLQETAARVTGAMFEPPLIICNESHRFIVAEQLRAANIVPRNILLEPVGRNTAPAAALAALVLMESDPEHLMLLLPSDHLITDIAGLQRAVAIGVKVARGGALVTFGVAPKKPETGYGYIRIGAENPKVNGSFAVDRFVEKPDLVTAKDYVKSGEYLWNSGMFLFSPAQFIDELEGRHPDIVDGCRAALSVRTHDLEFTRFDAASFAAVTSQSIDYAVMEHTDHAVVIPLDVGWSDLGSWPALWEIGEKDDAGNVIIGDVISADTTQCYLRSERPVIATVGLTDTVVIATEDVVMVSPMDRAQEVRGLVKQLKFQKRAELDAHVRVYRPWGWYQSIDAGPGYQVKNIQVNPGAKLSLQSHAHRAEHWVVVHGLARVTKGDEIFELRENESTFIPRETTHRLENATEHPLNIIEIQSGAYLGDDDIVRYEDTYGRLDGTA